MKKLICLLVLFVALMVASFTHRPLTWVAIGDSITYLNDHADETGNRNTGGYMNRVTEKLSYISCINQGHNGWSAIQIAQQFDKLAVPKGDVYTIFLGTNDWWQSRRIGAWEDYLDKRTDTTIYGAFRVIIDKIRSLNPNAPIVLMTPLQRGDFVYINKYSNKAHGSYQEHSGQTLEQVVAALLRIGEYEHIKVLDLYHDRRLSIAHAVKFKRVKDPATGEYREFKYPSYIGVPFDPAKDEYPYPPEASDMTFDGLHPSDKGNAYIAKQLVKIMKKF